MSEYLIQNFDYTRVDQPYADDLEYMTDFMKLMDLKLYYLYKYHPRVGPKSTQSYLGVVVSREEFEEKLVRSSEIYTGKSFKPEEIEDINLVAEYIDLRKQLSLEDGKLLSIPVLASLFKLSSFEEACITLSYACELDRKYEKIFGFLHDDVTKKLPSVELAIKLFAPVDSTISDYLKFFTRDQVLMKFFYGAKSLNEMVELSRGLKLDGRIIGYISDPESRNANLSGYIEIFNGDSPLEDIHIDGGIQEYLRRMILEFNEQGNGFKTSLVSTPLKVIYLHGPEGSGKKYHIKHLSKWLGSNSIFVDVKAMLEENEGFKASYRKLIREMVLGQSMVCLYNLDALAADEINSGMMLDLFAEFALYSKTLFVVSKNRIKFINTSDGILLIEIPFSIPDENSRFILWSRVLKDHEIDSDINPAELSGKFKFTPGQIVRSISNAQSLSNIEGDSGISAEILHRCCYNQVVNKLDEIASRIKPAHQWNSLILPEDQIEVLKSACNHIKYRHTVYSSWGFDQRITYGKGLSMLFSGPPGTGKTMAAQVIANQLHMEMYKIQLSQTVSKYIGETEKNLKKVFDEAKASNSIIFFDETDALFGKRSDVKDSHDRYANIETAFLLQQMEEYDGVVVMATNLLQNIDNAFLRRINYVIHFPFPDKHSRKRIWKSLIPGTAPLDKHVNFDFLAEKFEVSGGHIKNIVLTAAFMAAADGSPLNMTCLMKAAIHELNKNNMVFVKDDLEEYADLV